MSDWKNVQYKDGKYRTDEGGGGGGSSTLAGLDDVNITSATDGQVLKYDSQNDKWINGNGGGSSGHTYSTTEQVVGTWIDGKPIYECTWNFDTVISLPSNTWVNTPISVASKNIKAIIDCEAISSDYDSWGQISAGAGNGAYTYVQLHSSRPQYNSSVKVVTLRYTKTTD